MKKRNFLAAGLLAALLLSSCATKESAVNKLRAFQQEINVNGVTYTLNDWKDKAEEYAKLNKKVIKHYSEYTAEELEEIGRINAECVTSFTKATTQKLGSTLEGAASLIKGVVDGVKSSIGTLKQ